MAMAMAMVQEMMDGYGSHWHSWLYNLTFNFAIWEGKSMMKRKRCIK